MKKIIVGIIVLTVFIILQPDEPLEVRPHKAEAKCFYGDCGGMSCQMASDCGLGCFCYRSPGQIYGNCVAR